jgi:hypothetical protein
MDMMPYFGRGEWLILLKNGTKRSQGHVYFLEELPLENVCAPTLSPAL